MSSHDAVKNEFLALDSFAVVGISRTRGFGNSVYRDMKEKGYRVVPISLLAGSIDGDPCLKSLNDVTEAVSGVITVVPPAATLEVVRQCVAKGIRYIWMQQGSESAEAVSLAAENGIKTVTGTCIMMYASPKFPHNIHGMIHKLTGKY